MTPKKIYIRFASAEKLCEKSSDGEATMEVKTYPGKCDQCYTHIIWANAKTAKPQAKEQILYKDTHSHLHLLDVDPVAVTDLLTWQNLVRVLHMDSWTYTRDLL